MDDGPRIMMWYCIKVWECIGWHRAGVLPPDAILIKAIHAKFGKNFEVVTGDKWQLTCVTTTMISLSRCNSFRFLSCMLLVAGQETVDGQSAVSESILVEKGSGRSRRSRRRQRRRLGTFDKTIPPPPRSPLKHPFFYSSTPFTVITPFPLKPPFSTLQAPLLSAERSGGRAALPPAARSPHPPPPLGWTQHSNRGSVPAAADRAQPR